MTQFASFRMRIETKRDCRSVHRRAFHRRVTQRQLCAVPGIVQRGDEGIRDAVHERVEGTLDAAARGDVVESERRESARCGVGVRGADGDVRLGEGVIPPSPARGHGAQHGGLEVGEAHARVHDDDGRRLRRVHVVGVVGGGDQERARPLPLPHPAGDLPELGVAHHADAVDGARDVAGAASDDEVLGVGRGCDADGDPEATRTSRTRDGPRASRGNLVVTFSSTTPEATAWCTSGDPPAAGHPGRHGCRHRRRRHDAGIRSFDRPLSPRRQL